MKKTSKNRSRNQERFERLLFERLDTLERLEPTDKSRFHTGTERLLIHFAFERIRTNEYWRCVKCNSDIAESRLLSNPTTLTCSGCESVPE